LNSPSDVILPHKKFTWADFGGINTDIHPVATPLTTTETITTIDKKAVLSQR